MEPNDLVRGVLKALEEMRCHGRDDDTRRRLTLVVRDVDPHRRNVRAVFREVRKRHDQLMVRFNILVGLIIVDCRTTLT